jgi:hypothetical protein
MRFESHLGHSVLPRQRRFCFDVCTKLAVASSDGLGRGLWLAAAEPMQVCGVAGSSPWLVGLPPAVSGFLLFLVPVLSGGPGLAYTYSCAGKVGTT